MQKITPLFCQGVISPFILIFIGLLGILTTGGMIASPIYSVPEVTIRTEPKSGTAVVGELFTIQLIVTSSIPVNAFQGMFTFNNSILEVKSIEYNTSIADLWVEDPWYSNGAGTISFAGGTTKNGGFHGSGTLITITFKSLAPGNSYVGIQNARILKYDGLGTDASVDTSIDSIFTVQSSTAIYDILRVQKKHSTAISIQKEKPSTDLNSDGKQNLADISIFMFHLAQQNKRSDFNQDGVVNLSDLSIIMKMK